MISIYFPFSNLIGEKEKPKALMYQGFRLWRRARDSNPRNAFDVYTISNRAPSTSSDNSPYLQSNARILYMTAPQKSSLFFKNPELFIFALPAYRINLCLRGINIICKSANFTCFLLYCIEPGDEI